jgi:prevent-host-death family protein
MSKPKSIGLFEAKAKLSELVERAEHGERIIITRRGKAAAELRAITPTKKALTPGCAKNTKFRMDDDFNAPLEDFGD